jgi:hypothetical protein
MDNWISLSCPFCRTPFQIKEAYAHLRGRCPSCGFRIEPLKPKPYEEGKQVSTSDEPLGLVPIDEEWPEPPRLIAWDDRPHYNVAQGQVVARESYEHALGEPPIAFAPEPAKPQAAATPPAAPIVAEAVDDPPRARPAPLPKKPPPDPLAAFAPPGTRPKASPSPTPTPKVEVDILGEPIVQPERPVPVKAQPLDKTMEIPNLQPVLPPPRDPLGNVAPVAPVAQAPVVRTQPVNDAIYGVADADLPAVRGPGGEATPYRTNDIDFEVPPTPPVPPPEPPPLEPHSPYQLSDAELEPERPPPVPLHLFWTGVWNFAFRVANLRPLFWLTLGFTIMGAQVALIIQLYALELALADFAAFFVGLGVLFMLIITGSYASTCYLTILQDTAAGNDEIQYPDGDWRMGVFSLLRLALLTFLGLVLPAFIFSALGCFGYGLFILLTPALFSFCLLSALAGDSWIMIFDSRVMGGLKRRPDVIPIVYIYSLVLLLFCVAFTALGFLVHWLFVPLMAAVYAVCWLTFGRVLGRVGYAISEDPKKKRRKKKKKKRKAKVAADEDEEDDAEDRPVAQVMPEDSPEEPPP